MTWDTVANASQPVIALLAVAALGVSARALGANAASSREASRTRIDEAAPRVTIACPPMDWPPYAPVTMYGARAQPYRANQQFSMPGDAAQRVMLRAYAHLVNEGASSATVLLPDTPSAVRVVCGLGNPYDPPPENEQPLSVAAQMYRLRPGSEMWVVLEFEAQIFQWLPERVGGREPVELDLTKTIEVTDGFADGVLDSTVIELRVCPLQQHQRNEGTWVLRQPEVPGFPMSLPAVIVHPTTRTYRSEVRSRRGGSTWIRQHVWWIWRWKRAPLKS